MNKQHLCVGCSYKLFICQLQAFVSNFFLYATVFHCFRMLTGSSLLEVPYQLVDVCQKLLTNLVREAVKQALVCSV